MTIATWIAIPIGLLLPLISLRAMFWFIGLRNVYNEKLPNKGDGYLTLGDVMMGLGIFIAFVSVCSWQLPTFIYLWDWWHAALYSTTPRF